MQGGGAKRKPDEKDSTSKDSKRTRKTWNIATISEKNFAIFLKERQGLFRRLAQVFGNPQLFPRSDAINGECYLMMTNIHSNPAGSGSDPVQDVVDIARNYSPEAGNLLEDPLRELANETLGISEGRLQTLAQHVCEMAQMTRQEWMINCMEEILKASHSLYNEAVMTAIKKAGREFKNLKISEIDGKKAVAVLKNSIEHSRRSGQLPDIFEDIQHKLKKTRPKKGKVAHDLVSEAFPRLHGLFSDILQSHNIEKNISGREALEKLIGTMEARAKSEHHQLLPIQDCFDQIKGSYTGNVGGWTMLNELDSKLCCRPLNEIDGSFNFLRDSLQRKYRKYDLFREPPPKAPSIGSKRVTFGLPLVTPEPSKLHSPMPTATTAARSIVAPPSISDLRVINPDTITHPTAIVAPSSLTDLPAVDQPSATHDPLPTTLAPPSASSTTATANPTSEKLPTSPLSPTSSMFSASSFGPHSPSPPASDGGGPELEERRSSVTNSPPCSSPHHQTSDVHGPTDDHRPTDDHGPTNDHEPPTRTWDDELEELNRQLFPDVHDDDVADPDYVMDAAQSDQESDVEEEEEDDPRPQPEPQADDEPPQERERRNIPPIVRSVTTKTLVWPEDSVEGDLTQDERASRKYPPRKFGDKVMDLFNRLLQEEQVYPMNSHVYPKHNDVFLQQMEGEEPATDFDVGKIDGLKWHCNSGAKDLRGKLPGDREYNGMKRVCVTPGGRAFEFQRYTVRITPGNYYLHWWTGNHELGRADPSFSFGTWEAPRQYSEGLDQVKETVHHRRKRIRPSHIDPVKLNEFDTDKHKEVPQGEHYKFNPATPYRQPYFTALRVEDLEHLVTAVESSGVPLQHCRRFCPMEPKGGEVYIFDIRGSSTREFREFTRSDSYTWSQLPPRELTDGWILYQSYVRDNTLDTHSKRNYAFGKRLYENLVRDFGIIQYIGDEKVIVRHPHGNSRQNRKPFFRKHPSVMEECQELGPTISGNHAINEINSRKRRGILGEVEKVSGPQQLYFNRVTARGLNEHSLTQSILNFNIACQIVGPHTLRKTTGLPDRSYILITPSAVANLNYIIEQARIKGDLPLVFSYDTTFNLQDQWYGTALCLMNPMATSLRNPDGSDIPAIYPIGLIIHDTRPMDTHLDFSNKLTTTFPALATVPHIIVSDREFKDMKFFDKITHRALCWNHIIKNVEFHVRNMGGITSRQDQRILNGNMKALLRSSTEESYQRKLHSFFNGQAFTSTSGGRDYTIVPHRIWADDNFQDYFLRHQDEDIRRYAGRWYLESIGYKNAAAGITSNPSESFNHMFKSATFSITADKSVATPSQFLLDCAGFLESIDFEMHQIRYSASNKYTLTRKYEDQRKPFPSMPTKDDEQTGFKYPRNFLDMREELLARIRAEKVAHAADPTATFPEATTEETASTEAATTEAATQEPAYKTMNVFYPMFQKVEERAARILEDEERNIIRLRGIGGHGNKQVHEPNVPNPFVVSTRGMVPSCTCTEVGMCPHILAVLVTDGDRELNSARIPQLTPNDCEAITYFLNKRGKKRAGRTGSKIPRASDLMFAHDAEPETDRRIRVKCTYSPPRKYSRTPRTPRVPRRTGTPTPKKSTVKPSARKTLDFGYSPIPEEDEGATRILTSATASAPAPASAQSSVIRSTQILPIDGLQWSENGIVKNTCTIDAAITICAVQRSDISTDEPLENLKQSMLAAGDYLLNFAIENIDKSSKVQMFWANSLTIKCLQDPRVERLKEDYNLFGSVSGKFLPVLNGFRLKRDLTCTNPGCDQQSPKQPRTYEYLQLKGDSVASTFAAHANGDDLTGCTDCGKGRIIMDQVLPNNEHNYGLMIEVDYTDHFNTLSRREQIEYCLNFLEDDVFFAGHNYKKAGFILCSGSVSDDGEALSGGHFVAIVNFEGGYYFYDGNLPSKHKFQEFGQQLIDRLVREQYSPDKVMYLRNDLVYLPPQDIYQDPVAPVALEGTDPGPMSSGTPMETDV